MAYHPFLILGFAIHPWIDSIPLVASDWTPFKQRISKQRIYRQSQILTSDRFINFCQIGFLISDLSRPRIEVMGHHTQVSILCDVNLESRTAGFRILLHVCRESLFDRSVLLLSSWESLIPTLLRPQTVQICVGFCPSTNGVRYPVLEIRLHQYQRIIRSVFHTWIWDPGIHGCESNIPKEFGLHIWSSDVKRVSHQSFKFLRSMDITFEQISPETAHQILVSDVICQGSYSNIVKEVELFFVGFDQYSVSWKYHIVPALGYKRLRNTRSILSSYQRHLSDTSPSTSSLNLINKVMPRAFWSLSSKLLAITFMKEGHSRLHLLAYKPTARIAWLLIEIVSISYFCE